MAQIYISSAVTSVLAAAVWGTTFGIMSGRYRRLAWLVAVTLPFSAAVNFWVKRPLAAWVAAGAGVDPGLTAFAPLWFLVFAHLLAPVTEEAAKLAPALLPPIRRRLAAAADGQVSNGRLAAVWAGMWLGIGFGLGELWLIAWSVAQTPALAAYPWWQYTGFMTERLVSIYAHGVMTAVAVYGIALGPRRVWLTYAAAVGLHALVNAGAMLYQLGRVSAAWSQALLLVSLLLLTLAFQRLLRLPGALEPRPPRTTSTAPAPEPRPPRQERDEEDRREEEDKREERDEPDGRKVEQ